MLPQKMVQLGTGEGRYMVYVEQQLNVEAQQGEQ